MFVFKQLFTFLKRTVPLIVQQLKHYTLFPFSQTQNECTCLVLPPTDDAFTLSSQKVLIRNCLISKYPEHSFKQALLF